MKKIKDDLFLLVFLANFVAPFVLCLYLFFGLEWGALKSMIVSALAFFALFWLADVLIYEPRKERENAEKEAEKRAERDKLIEEFSSGKASFPSHKFYLRCIDSGCKDLESPFFLTKARLVANELMKEAEMPEQYFSLYNSDEKLKAYFRNGRNIENGISKRKQEEATRIANTPHNAAPTDREQKAIDNQNLLSGMTAVEKRKYMLDAAISNLNSEIYDIEHAVENALNLASVVTKSAAQEKTLDWSIAGGIADGIAGPGAGLAVAADTMRRNAAIEQRNQQNQAFANGLAADIISSAFNAPRDKLPLLKTQRDNLKKELNNLPTKVILEDIDQNQISKALILKKASIKSNKSGVLEIAATIKNNFTVSDMPEGVRFTIDGSLKGMVYAGDLLVDTINIPLPLFGVECDGGAEEVKAYCSKYSKNGKAYELKIKPNHLWVIER